MDQPVLLKVPLSAPGGRLDRALQLLAQTTKVVAGLSRARLQSLINSGDIRLNGNCVCPSAKVRPGDEISINIPMAVKLELAPENQPLNILFEDAHILAIAKPAGLSVHPGAGIKSGTLVNALLGYCSDLSGIGGVSRPGIVHRLDRGTSGVIVVAKNDQAHQGLAAQFAQRKVKKTYLAFVLGVPHPSVGTIDTLYGRHPHHRTRFSSQVSFGKRAVTQFAVTGQSGGIARLEVLLLTGRTHQIRVHLSDRGFPIVGDPLYGGRKWSKISDPKLARIAQNLDHQALHAFKLEIRHPVFDTQLIFVAPLPLDIAELSQAMEQAGR